MRKAKFSDILEECLTAVHEERRTVEECLSLYPDESEELEPLLRTALTVSSSFEAEAPVWHVQERIRNRVLAEARVRFQGRHLVEGIDLTRSGPWGVRHWGVLGAAAAAVVGAVFVASVMVFSGGGGENGGDIAGRPSPSEAPPVLVTDLTDDLAKARAYLELDGPVDTTRLENLLNEINGIDSNYGQSFSTLTPDQQDDLREFVNEVDQFVSTLPEPDVTDPVEPSGDADVRNTLEDKVKELADDWGAVATPTPAPTPVPTPTDGPPPTDGPTAPPVTPTPVQPTPTPVQPTSAPTQTQAPVDEDGDPIRAPQ